LPSHVVKFKLLDPRARPPRRASNGAVGFDARALYVIDPDTRQIVSELPADIPPGGKLLIGTGVAMAIPYPVDCQVRPRSGLATKHDIELSNSPGTVDPDYRGDIGIVLRNRGAKPFTVTPGMRVAQLVFTTVLIPAFEKVEELPPSLRDTGGFGSTGLGEIAEGDEASRNAERRMDLYYLKLAEATAELSDCLRGAERRPDGTYARDAEGRYAGATRRIGALIVKEGNIVATGYNTRTPECNEREGCIRERLGIASGTRLEAGCMHAESRVFQNHARTGGVSLEGATLYITTEPCLMCVKAHIIGSGISTVVVPKSGSGYKTNGVAELVEAGIEVRFVKK